MTDPIADLLTRIRNAVQAGHEELVCPRSKLKVEIIKILKQEGFVSTFEEQKDNKQGLLKIFPRYDQGQNPVMRGIIRISKPSRRYYVGKADIPRVRNGLGIAILTTARGVMTDADARAAGVGGEVICHVW